MTNAIMLGSDFSGLAFARLFSILLIAGGVLVAAIIIFAVIAVRQGRQKNEVSDSQGP